MRSGRRAVPAAALSAALGAVVLAGCSAGGGPSTSATTTTSGGTGTPTSTAPAPTTTTGPLGAGQLGTAAQVPWKQVGTGWVLATWRSAAPAGTPQAGPAPTLLLVDPEGGRYKLGTAPRGTRLSAWSGDGTHALFSSGPSTTSVTVVELETGATTTVSPGGQPGYDGVRFTRPDGLALLVGGPPVRRLGLDGSAQLSFPPAPATAGTGARETGGENGGYAETPAGGTLALQAAGGVDILSNSGTFTRFIPAAGQTSCIVVKWWTSTSLLLTCGAQLVVQPATGGSSTELTSAPTTFLDAWQVGTATVAEAGACGTTWLNSVSGSGAVTRLVVPHGTGSVTGISATGSQLLVLATAACDQGASSSRADTLEWYEPSNGQATALLGAGSGAGGWVTGADLFGDPTG